MFLFFMSLLETLVGIKVPAVFEYYSTRMALAAITSLLVTILCGKKLIKKLYEWKIGDCVRSEDCPLLGELHRNKNDTPTMGGVLILLSLLVSLFLWMDLSCVFTLILFLTTVTMGCIGGYDDYLKLRYKNKKGLSGKNKLFLQGTFAALLALYLLWPAATEALHQGKWFCPPHAKVVKISSSSTLGQMAQLTTQEFSSRIYIPCKKEPLFEMKGFFLVAMGLMIIFVVTGSSNAVNLTDGLDGLATGTVMLASAAFALIAFVSNHADISRYLNIPYIEGSGEIGIYLSALAGACLGFLWYNGHPAQVFMGDTGSLTLGAILGVSAVLLKRELLLALIGGVFVIEALSVILQVASYRLRNKKRVFLCSPLHHHFEYQGWAETKVVIRFWIVGLLCALLGIATLKFQ